MDVMPKWAEVVLVPLISLILAALLSALVILAILDKTTFNLVIVIAVLDSTRRFRPLRASAPARP